jgi:hypothetical protein
MGLFWNGLCLVNSARIVMKLRTTVCKTGFQLPFALLFWEKNRL